MEIEINKAEAAYIVEALVRLRATCFGDAFETGVDEQPPAFPKEVEVFDEPATTATYYGFDCRWNDFIGEVRHYDLGDPCDALMVSTSLQSDAQELLAMGNTEQARQTLNLSKRLISGVRELMKGE